MNNLKSTILLLAIGCASLQMACSPRGTETHGADNKEEISNGNLERARALEIRDQLLLTQKEIDAMTLTENQDQNNPGGENDREFKAELLNLTRALEIWVITQEDRALTPVPNSSINLKQVYLDLKMMITGKKLPNGKRYTLYDDIRKSPYEVKLFVPEGGKDSPPPHSSYEGECLELDDQPASASAKLNDLGGTICFDARILAKETPRDQIELLALAMHEYAHHFGLEQKRAIDIQQYILRQRDQLDLQLSRMGQLKKLVENGGLFFPVNMTGINIDFQNVEIRIETKAYQDPLERKISVDQWNDMFIKTFNSAGNRADLNSFDFSIIKSSDSISIENFSESGQYYNAAYGFIKDKGFSDQTEEEWEKTGDFFSDCSNLIDSSYSYKFNPAKPGLLDTQQAIPLEINPLFSQYTVPNYHIIDGLFEKISIQLYSEEKPISPVKTLSFSDNKNRFDHFYNSAMDQLNQDDFELILFNSFSDMSIPARFYKRVPLNYFFYKTISGQLLDF